nr:toll-like receptor 2 [Pogona vitticeps]
MWRTETFVLFFLLCLKNLMKANGSCYLEQSQSQCVCSVKDLEQTEIQTFLTCTIASIYELRGGNLTRFGNFSGVEPHPQIIEILENLPVQKLIFTDVIVPEILLPGALAFVSHTPLVSALEFVNCTFLRAAHWHTRNILWLKISSLRFHRVIADPLDDRFDISSWRSWLENLENLTISESQVTSIPCKIGVVFTALHLLDISGNRFQDESLSSSFCEGAFPQLQILKLNRNNLTSYETVCRTLSHLRTLAHLDLSQNSFPPDLLSSPCTWPQSLRIFNLSNTGLQYMDKSLPPNIEILDLSANSILTLDLSTPGLKELYLSKNRLQTVPPVEGLPSLEILTLDQNQIPRLHSKGLLLLKNLRSLKAGLNLYNCSCRRYIQEIQDLATQRTDWLQDWPHNYICRSPPQYQNYLLDEVPLSSLQCNKALVSHGSVVSLLICLHLVLRWLPV